MYPRARHPQSSSARERCQHSGALWSALTDWRYLLTLVGRYVRIGDARAELDLQHHVRVVEEHRSDLCLKVYVVQRRELVNLHSLKLTCELGVGK